MSICPRLTTIRGKWRLADEPWNLHMRDLTKFIDDASYRIVGLRPEPPVAFLLSARQP